MGRAAIAVGAILIVGGGGALGYAFTRKATGGMTPEATTAMTEALGRLDGDLKLARGQVAERAKTLAGLQAVRSAVDTDSTSAMEAQERGELNFAPTGTEIVAMGENQAGKVIPFLVQPAGKQGPTHAGTPETRIRLAGTEVELLEVVKVDALPVTPPNPPGDGGWVAVSRTMSIGEAITRLADAQIAGRFELGDESVAIGTMPAAGVTTKARPLPSEPTARIVVAVPVLKAALPIPVVGAGAGAAALGLLLVVIGLMTGRSKSAAAAEDRPDKPTRTQPGMGPANRPSIRNLETKLTDSQPIATGTPGSFDAGQSIAHGDLGPGAMIGRWEVVRRLGSGGMADVYLARSRGEAGFEKLVAVKIMHPHLARNQHAVDHFLDEARLASRIVHPNVVAIQDLGKIGEDYVIVMDYVEGVDLERLLASARAAQRPVPLDIGLGILCRICDGLNAAHTAVAPDGTPLGVIHRDVKSANVLVSRQGGVKVVDFGIAKATTQSHLTVQGETKGTPSMMAPEQRVGERVDVRADVYAVGAVGFEVVTGHAVNLDLAALAHLGIENWPHLPPPSQLRPEVPHELDKILLTAMSFEREKRPPNCAAFESQVEAVMKRHGMAASDKDIARWVETELRQLSPAFQGATERTSQPGATNA